MQEKSSQLSPQFWEHVSPRGAVLAGFDLARVQDSACALVCHGFVPVEDDYCLMEHIATGQQSHFRKITFIK